MKTFLKIFSLASLGIKIVLPPPPPILYHNLQRYHQYPTPSFNYKRVTNTQEGLLELNVTEIVRTP